MISNAAPFSLKVYNVNKAGTPWTFTEIAASTLLTPSIPSPVHGIRISPNFNYIILRSNTAPHIFVYKRTGATFTLQPTPTGHAFAASTQLGMDSSNVIFSKDSKFFAVVQGSTMQIHIFKEGVTNFEHVPQTPTIPNSNFYTFLN